jgi:rubrerythrin
MHHGHDLIHSAMKTLFIRKSFLLACTCCLALVACDQAKKENIQPQQPMDPKTQTIANMQSAYRGEMTATAKYTAFSKKAEQEGYHQIAVLYQAVSAAESIHAANHMAVIEDAGAVVPAIVPEYKVRSTQSNLEEDINGEAYEAQTMYPDFLRSAQAADNQTAYLSLTYAMKTERKHQAFFERALAAIRTNTLDRLPIHYAVCPACGNTYPEAPPHCDFSLTPKAAFLEFQ